MFVELTVLNLQRRSKRFERSRCPLGWIGEIELAITNTIGGSMTELSLCTLKEYRVSVLGLNGVAAAEPDLVRKPALKRVRVR